MVAARRDRPGPPADGGNRVAVVRDILVADGQGFVTRAVEEASLGFGGLEHDRHAGATRRSCARTPWHPRGTVIANTRQVSIVSAEECDEIARLLGVAAVDARLLGANLVVAGIPGLTGLAPGTRLRCRSGATLFVTEENVPCRRAAAALARGLGEPDVAQTFVGAASGRRGLVGLVECQGRIARGDIIEIIVPRRLRKRPLPTLAVPLPISSAAHTGATGGSTIGGGETGGGETGGGGSGADASSGSHRRP